MPYETTAIHWGFFPFQKSFVFSVQVREMTETGRKGVGKDGMTLDEKRIR